MSKIMLRNVAYAIKQLVEIENMYVKTIPLHTCSACTSTELPFHNTRNLNETIDNETQIIRPSMDFHINKI